MGVNLGVKRPRIFRSVLFCCRRNAALPGSGAPVWRLLPPPQHVVSSGCGARLVEDRPSREKLSAPPGSRSSRTHGHTETQRSATDSGGGFRTSRAIHPAALYSTGSVASCGSLMRETHQLNVLLEVRLQLAQLLLKLLDLNQTQILSQSAKVFCFFLN